jgi:hypothetical protein
VAGAQIEVIRIREDDFRAELFEGFLGEAFDGGLRAHGHEKRGLYRTVGRSEAAAARAGWVGLRDFKRKTHSESVSGENPCDGGTQQGEEHVDANYYASGF